MTRGTTSIGPSNWTHFAASIKNAKADDRTTRVAVTSDQHGHAYFAKNAVRVTAQE